MIRPAKFFDTMRIVELLEEAHAKSKYAEHTGVCRKAAHAIVQNAIHRHGHSHAGGTFMVVSIKDQKVEGFMMGLLDRVYHIGEKLVANDVFLYCSTKADPSDFLKMFDAYTKWAAANPKVIEIRASWMDTIPGADRMGELYDRKGFRRCGEIYERHVDVPQEVAA